MGAALTAPPAVLTGYFDMNRANLSAETDGLVDLITGWLVLGSITVLAAWRWWTFRQDNGCGGGHPTVFTHNRDRLLEAEVAHEFLAALLALPQVKRLLSSELSDGTLIDAWASMKSFRPKDGSGEPPSPGRWRTRPPQGEALE